MQIKRLYIPPIAMPKKGKQKNTENKAKHAKLMHRKKNKLRKDKEARAARLKELVHRINTQQDANT